MKSLCIPIFLDAEFVCSVDIHQLPNLNGAGAVFGQGRDQNQKT